MAKYIRPFIHFSFTAVPAVHGTNNTLRFGSQLPGLVRIDRGDIDVRRLRGDVFHEFSVHHMYFPVGPDSIVDVIVAEIGDVDGQAVLGEFLPIRLDHHTWFLPGVRVINFPMTAKDVAVHNPPLVFRHISHVTAGEYIGHIVYDVEFLGGTEALAVADYRRAVNFFQLIADAHDKRP